MIYLNARLYEDELVYSWFARCWIKSGYINFSDFLKELYGTRGKSSIEFLKKLAPDAETAVAKNISKERLIWEHTMFPQYARFISKENRDSAFNSLLNGDNDYSRLLCVIRGNQGKEKYLRYCPDCANEDRLKLGETFWHRKHQIQGCTVCQKHKCKLFDTEIKNKDTNSNLLHAAEEIVPRNAEADYNISEIEYKVSCYLTELFNAEITDVEVTLGSFLKSKMENTKYAVQRGNFFDVKMLFDDYIKFYDELENDNPIQELRQLKQILSNNRISFYSAALIAFFLGISVDDLVSMEMPEKNQQQLFDEQVLKLRKQGKNYREIAEELDSNLYLVGAIITGNTKSHYRRRERKASTVSQKWESLDKEMLPLVKEKINVLLSMEKPQRITKKKIMGLIGRDMFSCNRMPLCRAEIEKYEEENGAFWLKKIEWAANEIRKDGSVNFAWYRVITKSSVPLKSLPECVPYLQNCKDEELLEMINTALARMNEKENLGRTVRGAAWRK